MTYSSSFVKTLTEASGNQAPVLLVEITHASLGTPIRLTQDVEDIISNGNTYTALGFYLELPSQPESGSAEARIVIDNVSKDVMYWLETTNGARDSRCKIMQISKSAPNTIEYSLDLIMTDIVANSRSISARLSYIDIYNKQCFPTVYDIRTAPGAI